MEKVPPKQKKLKGETREQLLLLDKNELVDRIIQLEAHNLQLKNIVGRNLSKGTIVENNTKGKPYDFTKCHFRRILLHILYFGWDYQGLAVQEDSIQTIEHHLFNALTKACLVQSRETAQYHRCGRTDKGVSAFGQVLSLTVRSKLPPSAQQAVSDDLPYCKLLNRLLPADIRAVAWTPASTPEFSARFDCKKRQYKYYFPRSHLDIPSMRDACRHLIGSHDFRHLCKMDVGNGVVEFRREILRADILPVNEDSELPTTMYNLIIEGNAFLWHQIRCIMGVLLLVGERKESATVVEELLDIDTYPRKPQYNMALDMPLNLFHCTYDFEDEKWIYDKAELKSVIAQLQGAWTLHNTKATMLKDCIDRLEDKYKNISCKSGTADTDSGESEKDRVIAYTDCLIQGVKARVYTPLLKRVTCSSLEERIEHYRKKRKILSDTVDSSVNVS